VVVQSAKLSSSAGPTRATNQTVLFGANPNMKSRRDDLMGSGRVSDLLSLALEFPNWPRLRWMWYSRAMYHGMRLCMFIDQASDIQPL
jgi:hypothetical protein